MAGRWQFFSERAYYRTLDVSSQANEAEIKRAHRRLVREVHPDTNSSDDAAARFNRIEEAYEFLRNVDRREVYDAGGGDFVTESQGAMAHGGDDVLPPAIVLEEISFGEIRQGERVQGQETIEVGNPNGRDLKLQIFPARGSFWEARLSENDGLRFSVYTTSLKGRPAGNYYDRLRVGWEGHPDSFVELPIYLIVTPEPELPPRDVRSKVDKKVPSRFYTALTGGFWGFIEGVLVTFLIAAPVMRIFVQRESVEMAWMLKTAAALTVYLVISGFVRYLIAPNGVNIRENLME